MTRRRTVLLGSISALSAAYGGKIASGALRLCTSFEVNNRAIFSARRIGERLLELVHDAAHWDENAIEELETLLPEKIRQVFSADNLVDCDASPGVKQSFVSTVRKF